MGGERPGGITILAILYILGGLFALAGGAMMLSGGSMFGNALGALF